MKNLTELLKAETESLKIQYLEMTSKWAHESYSVLRSWAAEYVKGSFGFSEASKKYYSLPSSIIRGEKEIYITRAIKAAEEHYEMSIEKLAFRITKKNLNIDSLTLITSHIGVNIETVLTDGEKFVKAFTIIAGGAIQRPHYRYLIK